MRACSGRRAGGRFSNEVAFYVRNFDPYFSVHSFCQNYQHVLLHNLICKLNSNQQLSVQPPPGLELSNGLLWTPISRAGDAAAKSLTPGFAAVGQCRTSTSETVAQRQHFQCGIDKKGLVLGGFL